ncbi:hypothetical protein D3C87_1877260 [compost metagenome]
MIAFSVLGSSSIAQTESRVAVTSAEPEPVSIRSPEAPVATGVGSSGFDGGLSSP